MVELCDLDKSHFVHSFRVHSYFLSTYRVPDSILGPAVNEIDKVPPLTNILVRTDNEQVRHLESGSLETDCDGDLHTESLLWILLGLTLADK